MEQFDVCKLKRGDIVVILQHATFSSFATRVVAPLFPKSKGNLATSLNPVLRYARRDWVLGTHLMNVLPLSVFDERLGSLSDQDYVIKRAIDQLFLGV